MERLFHVKLLKVGGTLGESTSRCNIVIVLEVRAELCLGKAMLKTSATF